ncbi:MULTISPECIES: nucleoside triphosphate pyrophosphohydrolase family protein [Holospora]|uniref:Uncharacterized protein n=2 Tax=Holospora TaxID=44747 RepID=A0A061JGB6_9PROT|nr:MULTISPECIES: hypothetical protein [Holospora]ETZ05036.1 hypothetical protein K737_300551 [Holospora undulata HU1]GAJ46289.1 hypothetical protein HE1_00617 [Holospora elegans E1]
MKKIFLCDKLVRDRAQSLNSAQDLEGVYRVLGLAERPTYAKKKILEEAQEALDDLEHHNKTHGLSELADVIQAAQALLELNNEINFDFFSSSILSNFLERLNVSHEKELETAQLLVNQAKILKETPTSERDVINICLTVIKLTKILGYSSKDLEKEFFRKEKEKGAFKTWTCLTQITLPQEHPKFLNYSQRYPMLDLT